MNFLSLSLSLHHSQFSNIWFDSCYLQYPQTWYGQQQMPQQSSHRSFIQHMNLYICWLHNIVVLLYLGKQTVENEKTTTNLLFNCANAVPCSYNAFFRDANKWSIDNDYISNDQTLGCALHMQWSISFVAFLHQLAICYYWLVSISIFNKCMNIIIYKVHSM